MNTATVSETRTLLDMMNSVDLSIVEFPKDEVGKNETSVGIMSDGLKKLYHLHSVATDELRKVAGENRTRLQEHEKKHVDGSKHSIKDCIAFHKEMQPHLETESKLKQKYDVMKGIFWNAARFEHPELMGKETIGVRKDAMLVWEAEDEELGELPDLVMELLSSAFSHR